MNFFCQKKGNEKISSYIIDVGFFGEVISLLENSVINDIRNSVDIVEVISDRVPLTARGKNYFGVCPFHDDHSPSMSVSREKQIYTCFSCGATGNVFKFLQDFENISFLEAVQWCADLAGIPFQLNYSHEKKNEKFQTLYDIYEIAQKFYQNNMNSKEAKDAKQYLKDRALPDEAIKTFEIGLSLEKGNLLTNLLKQKHYDDKDLLASGLVGEQENSIQLYDLYRNRIMFPLHDARGRLVGYNGRAYHGETTNKYVNSKESPIFKKREILYNYHRAKEAVRIKKCVIIMEGPMDVIRAYTIGFSNVVASLGTAFGSEQALLVRKLSSNVILCFDGDEAGLKATKSAIEEFSKIGMEPRVVRLEENLDPDEYIRKYGKDAFLHKLNTAIDTIEFKEFLLKANIDMDNTVDVANYANAMIEEFKKMKDETLLEVSMAKLSEETHLSIDFIRGKVGDIEKKPLEINLPISPRKKWTKWEKSERNLLAYMLKFPNAIKMYDKKITHMPTDQYRQLGFQISSFYRKYGYIDVADLLTELRDDTSAIETIGEISQLKVREELDSEEIEDYLNNIKEYNEKVQLDIYQKELKKSNDYNRKIELAKKVVASKLRSEEDNGRN